VRIIKSSPVPLVRKRGGGFKVSLSPERGEDVLGSLDRRKKEESAASIDRAGEKGGKGDPSNLAVRVMEEKKNDRAKGKRKKRVAPDLVRAVKGGMSRV